MATPDASFFVSGFHYYEERGNGTPLQFNHTGTGGGAIDGRLGTLDNGELRFAAYAHRKRLTSPEPSTRLGATWLRVELGADPKTQPTEARAMAWEAPDFVEVKMDAEINSYQDDFGRARTGRPLLRPEPLRSQPFSLAVGPGEGLCVSGKRRC